MIKYLGNPLSYPQIKMSQKVLLKSTREGRHLKKPDSFQSFSLIGHNLFWEQLIKSTLKLSSSATCARMSKSMIKLMRRTDTFSNTWRMATVITLLWRQCSRHTGGKSVWHSVWTSRWQHWILANHFLSIASLTSLLHQMCILNCLLTIGKILNQASIGA